MIQLWMLFLSVTIVTGKILPVQKSLYKERVIVGHFHHQLRQRRSIEDNPTLFPESIRLTFNLKGHLCDLNLTRKELLNQHIIQDGTYTYRASEDIRNQDHAIYQNVTQGAALTMRCADFDYLECELHGIFGHRGGLFHLEPVEGDQNTLYEINEISYKHSRGAPAVLSAERALQMKIARYERDNATIQSRSKRASGSTPGPWVVEMAFWFDNTIWQQFMALNDQNATLAEADVNVFAVGIMNEVDIRMQNIQVKLDAYNLRMLFDCNAMLNYIRICKDPSQCLWSTNGNSGGTISATADSTILSLVNEIGSIPIGYDTIAGITLYEVRDTKGVNDEIMGIYYYRDIMCVGAGSQYVASIVNAKNGAVGFNLAHMIMHYWGAYGDGSDSNCTETDNYIGTKQWSVTTDASLAVNPFTWSYCSMQRLKNKLLSTNNIDCLKSHNFDTALYAQYHTASLLGEVYDLNKQCSLETGTSTSTFCGSQDPSMCYQGLSCTDPSTGNCVASQVFPYSGTRCEKPGFYPLKYCYNGTCVDGPKSTYYKCELSTLCSDDFEVTTPSNIMADPFQGKTAEPGTTTEGNLLADPLERRTRVPDSTTQRNLLADPFQQQNNLGLKQQNNLDLKQQYDLDLKQQNNPGLKQQNKLGPFNLK